MTPDPILTVVGAGPVGSFAALKAAELGINVRVFEEHPIIGEPDHCTGHVSIQGLKRINLKLPDKLIQKKVNRYELFSPGGNNLSIESSSPRTLIVDRAHFDKWLSHQAERKGVEYHRNCRVDLLQHEKGERLDLILRHRKKLRLEDVDLVLNAEGYPPTLLIKGGYTSINLSQKITGIQVKADKIEASDDGCVEVYFGSQYADGLYAWIAPLPDGSAKVGLASRRHDPRTLLYRFIKKHPVASKKFFKTRFSSPILHSIPITRPLTRTCWPHLITVGDSASQVKATTGGGVITGLTCALYAGKVSAIALLEKNFHQIYSYEKNWRQALSYDFNLMVYFRKILNTIPDKTMDKLFFGLKGVDVNELFKYVDFDLQGTSIIKLLKDRRSLSKLFNLFIRCLI
ncbi:NAD(P)/FAD-dependent oxidoreductase [[Eubacterium] cellulosolvens]